MNLNEIYFAGHAGGNAEIRVSKNGSEYSAFNVCHTRKEKDKPDEAVSTWVTVFCYGYNNEIGKQVAKGNNVFVKGRLCVEDYTDKNGKERRAVKIVANAITIVPRTDNKHELPPDSSYASYPPQNMNFPPANAGYTPPPASPFNAPPPNQNYGNQAPRNHVLPVLPANQGYNPNLPSGTTPPVNPNYNNPPHHHAPPPANRDYGSYHPPIDPNENLGGAF